MTADRQVPAIQDTGAGQGGGRMKLQGYLWAGLTVAIFSGWFVVTRFAVTHELTIWDVSALRFGIGAVLLAPAVLRTGHRLPLATWGAGFLFAILWGAPFVLLVALGLRLTSASEAASVAPTLMPVFTGVLAWIFLKERPGRVRLLGYGAILAGLAIMVASNSDGFPSPPGLIALVVAAAMWAIYTLVFRNSGLTPIQGAALICIWSAIVFLPIYGVLGLNQMSLASPGEIGFQAFYQGVLMSGVALFAFNRAVALLGARAATAIIALIPASATFLGLIFLREVPTIGEWLAVAIIVLGVSQASKA